MSNDYAVISKEVRPEFTAKLLNDEVRRTPEHGEHRSPDSTSGTINTRTYRTQETSGTSMRRSANSTRRSTPSWLTGCWRKNLRRRSST